MDRLRRLPVLGTAIRMQERYVDDAADALAASIGLFAFLSLFPLLALVLAVVGFFFVDDVIQRQEIVAAMQRSIPAFAALAGDDTQIGLALETVQQQRRNLLGFGTIGLVLAGLRIASGAQQASAVVFRRELPTGLDARLGQVGALAATGSLALVGAMVGGSVGVELGSGAAELANSLVGIGTTFLIDVAVFAVAYRLFTPGPGPDWATVLPGSLLAGAGWVALKLFGTGYVTSQAQTAPTSGGATGGAVGSIIALLLLFYLAGRLYLYGAELAALLAHVDEVPSRDETAADAVRVPQVSPAPRPDVPPEPGDAARLAVSGVLLGAAASMLGRLLRR